MLAIRACQQSIESNSVPAEQKAHLVRQVLPAVREDAQRQACHSRRRIPLRRGVRPGATTGRCRRLQAALREARRRRRPLAVELLPQQRQQCRALVGC